jgi:hypothetical protein
MPSTRAEQCGHVDERGFTNPAQRTQLNNFMDAPMDFVIAHDDGHNAWRGDKSTSYAMSAVAAACDPAHDPLRPPATWMKQALTPWSQSGPASPQTTRCCAALRDGTLRAKQRPSPEAANERHEHPANSDDIHIDDDDGKGPRRSTTPAGAG